MTYEGSGRYYRHIGLVYLSVLEFYNKMINQEVRSEVHKAHQKIKGIKYCCAPVDNLKQCSDKIVKAHSISKCLGLNEIKNADGRVMSIKLNNNTYTLEESRGVIPVVEQHINSASTGNFFCSEHDKKIFSPIEDQEFQLNFKSCFLLAYRSTCMEYFKRRNDFLVNPVMVRDIEVLKIKMDEILIKEKYELMDHYVFEVEDARLLTSMAYTPVVNFKGVTIQNEHDYNSVLKSVIVNVVKQKDKEYIIFSFLEEDRPFFNNFIDGLLIPNKNKQAIMLTNYMFKIFENLHWSKSWWDGLLERRRKELLDYIQIYGSKELVKKHDIHSKMKLRLNVSSQKKHNKNLIKAEKNLYKNIGVVKNKHDQAAFKIQQSYFLSDRLSNSI